VIEYSDATVFNVPAQTLVNTVNGAGAMGAGIALEFRLRYPEMFGEYAGRCRRGEVEPGVPYLYRGYGDPWILNFPTKRHWRDPSRLEWVEAGLERFASMYKEEGVTSAAFPPLGCTNGGLEWDRVRPLMERYLGPLDLKATVCLDREAAARGVEGRMVGLLNDPRHPVWTESRFFPAEAVEGAQSARPFRRLRDLMRVPGISRERYADLFRLLYRCATGGIDPTEPDNAVVQEEKPVQLTFTF
jgi:O-acetyl-ADP-ribose deacetylase (regulator of RNase III)